jgi:acyl transferase domain-containing protein
MTAVARSAEEVQAALAEAGIDGVVLANHNHPTQVILSGPTKAIEGAEAALGARGLTCQRLAVATAFHSPVVASALAPFRAFIDGIDGALSTDGPTVYANTTAAAYTGDWRETLAGQITQPVRWVELIERMHADGIRHFVEVGPGTVLGGLVKRILKRVPHTVTSLDNRKKDGWLALLMAVGQLAADGVVSTPAGLLANHLVPVDPRTLARPKLAIPINGSNHGKPYPPKGGADARPKPNPPKPGVAPLATAPSTPPISAPAATPAATPRVEAPRMSDTPKPPAPQYAAPQPAPQYAAAADPNRIA